MRILVLVQERSRAVLRGTLERDTVFAFAGPLPVQIRITPRRSSAPCRVAVRLRVGRKRPSQVRRHRDRECAGSNGPGGSRCHVVAILGLQGAVYDVETGSCRDFAGNLTLRTW